MFIVVAMDTLWGERTLCFERVAKVILINESKTFSECPKMTATVFVFQRPLEHYFNCDLMRIFAHLSSCSPLSKYAWTVVNESFFLAINVAWIVPSINKRMFLCQSYFPAILIRSLSLSPGTMEMAAFFFGCVLRVHSIMYCCASNSIRLWRYTDDFPGENFSQTLSYGRWCCSIVMWNVRDNNIPKQYGYHDAKALS